MDRSSNQVRAEFEKTYTDFFEPIFLFLAARLNDRNRAKELAQETFMRTWMHLVKGHTIHFMRPFLYTTAYNLFKNELRRKKDALSLETLMEDGLEVKDHAANTEATSLARELLDRLEQLPTLQRETLKLRYIDGWPVKKIAEKCNESSSAVAVRIHRALKKLKKIYDYEKMD